MLQVRIGLVLVIGLLAGLSGCQQGNEAPLPQAASGMPAVAEPAAAKPDGAVSIDPAELGSCDVGAVVTVRWDMRATNPAVTDVEIWTGAPGKETIFAAGGYAGEAATGPWAYPGTTFLVRNKADGAELARAVVGGPSCN